MSDIILITSSEVPIGAALCESLSGAGLFVRRFAPRQQQDVVDRETIHVAVEDCSGIAHGESLASSGFEAAQFSESGGFR